MNNEAPNVGHSILAIFSPVKIGTNRQQKLKQLCSNVKIFAWCDFRNLLKTKWFFADDQKFCLLQQYH